jgi:hypothetical protein
MCVKHSLLWLGQIPVQLGVAFSTVCAILALAPVLAGADFGLFKVPHVGPYVATWLKRIALPVLVCSFVPYLPMWPLVCPKVCMSFSSTAGPVVPATLDFINSSSKTIRITWRSPEGKEDMYNPIVIPPGRSSNNVETFLDDDWCVVDATTKDFIQEVRVTQTQQKVEVHDPR